MPRGTDQENVPRWNLDPVYRGFDDEAYTSDKERTKSGIAELLTFLENSTPDADPAAWLSGFIRRYNEIGDLVENLESYAYTRFSVDTRDETATNELNAMEALSVPLKRAEVLFRNSLASVRERLSSVLDSAPELAPYRFFIEEELTFQQKQMSPAEEDLAADLSRPGGEAWGRLQEAVSSTLSVLWDERTGERKTVVQLRGLAFSPDRNVRQKAYRKELEAWKQVETPMAFALNGVKGFSDILNTRRGYESTLERSIMQSRITPATLDALIGVMKDSMPLFRGYLKAKARLLGLDRLAFYDIFAPVGSSGEAEAGKAGPEETKSWSFEEARKLIVEQFGSFSDELAAFAESAFAASWIDAEPRDGKVGGAYCISFPLTGESRVLCNFDGSFSSLTTVAHELGHAYHHHVLKDVPHLQRSYPMTLAETASIFAESIVFNGALESCSEHERLGILEVFLADTTQVIVDILSRFIFENAVMDTRRERELSAKEFCDLMLQAQRETYGEALNPDELHPYMWAVKGHYYRQGLAFYNFPYAFGQLFGLGLYARFTNEGEAFADTYRSILMKTGIASANDVTRSAGFDIEKADFWRSGIEMIARKTDQFVELARKDV